jgi:maleate isomerase
MYGWRGRLGIIVPSSDATSEPDYQRYTPEGVSVYGSRMLLEDGTVDLNSLEQMADDVERCAELLATVDVDVVAYSCTTGSLVKGPGYDEKIENRITEAAGVPAVATAASIKRALNALDAESLAITTPYIDSLNKKEQDFLEESGYEVTTICGLGLETDNEIGREPEFRSYREAKKLDTEGADCVFVSCTGYRTLDIVEQLERDLGKPVVTSNQATLWDSLRELNIDYSNVELGEIFNR